MGNEGKWKEQMMRSKQYGYYNRVAGAARTQIEKEKMRRRLNIITEHNIKKGSVLGQKDKKSVVVRGINGKNYFIILEGGREVDPLKF